MKIDRLSIVSVILVCFLISACSSDPTLRVEVHNDSTCDLKNVSLIFGGSQINLGNISKGTYDVSFDLTKKKSDLKSVSVFHHKVGPSQS